MRFALFGHIPENRLYQLQLPPIQNRSARHREVSATLRILDDTGVCGNDLAIVI
jgi:hypothetical protein